MHQPVVSHHPQATVWVTVGEAIARYGFPNQHPFGPHRHGAFWHEAQRRGLDQLVTVRPPVAADRAALERFHTPDYVDRVMRLSQRGEGLLDHGDTPAFPGVYEAAAHVVGSTLDLLDGIMTGQCRRAFIPIAGLHHARPHTAGGFCVFNDCGVAIATLRQVYGVRKVAYVDIDAHHGDGVFYAFEEDPDLCVADLHQDGRTLYPGTGHAGETGRGAALGTKLNIPLPPGADDAAFRQAWQRALAFVTAAKPEFIILQCGADSIDGDPLTYLAFSAGMHAQAAADLCRLAESLGHGRVLACGGGGYNPRNIALGWCGVLSALVETPTAS